MNQSVVVFFPQNPLPAQTGAHRRCLEVLTALRSLGYETTLVSSRLTSYQRWQADSVRGLERDYVARVRVHRPGPLDYAVSAPIWLRYRVVGRLLPVNSRAYTPPGLRRFFTDVLVEADPRVILINYTCFDGLVDHARDQARLRVIDTHDLWSLNTAMKQALSRHLPRPPFSLDAVPAPVLDERFYQDRVLEAVEEEFRTFDRYNCTLAISRREADLIRRRSPRTRVFHVPVTMPVCDVANSYDGPALFVAGPNPFNLQGYCYFALRVLPILREQVPGFGLTVLGPYCGHLPPTAGVTMAGFVPDLATVYARARFAICPVFGGTGQQIKIVEAMAYGVPVVALRAPAEQSPIRHGVNGLVAYDAAGFAAHCAELWNNRELCATLGRAARETVAAECSPAHLTDILKAVLSSPVA